MPSIALAASSGEPMVTNANPRLLPVSRSETKWTSLTVPNCWKAVRTPSAVVLNERFPTYRRVFITVLDLARDAERTRPEGAMVLESGFQERSTLPTEHRANRRTVAKSEVTPARESWLRPNRETATRVRKVREKIVETRSGPRCRSRVTVMLAADV